jgi:hypothetical protein
MRRISEFLLPIATYIQITGSRASCWLIIASRAIAVLPVCRSPIISSRCPRPIGIRASTTFKPVSRGCATLSRDITSGAAIFIKRSSTNSRAPFSSAGSTRALNTRPTNLSPTFTLTIFLVRQTLSPTFTKRSSPKRIARTLSYSRFRARPLTPDSNSSISDAVTFLRP